MGLAPTMGEWAQLVSRSGSPVSFPRRRERIRGGDTVGGGPMRESIVNEKHGRFFLPGHEDLVDAAHVSELFFVEKMRRARQAARYLRHLGGIRFAAICNHLAQGQADAQSDIDFFIVTRAGTMWQTRGWASLPFALFGLRPRPQKKEGVFSPLCFSYFVDDRHLSFAPRVLEGDDPGARAWFLSFLPLIDDGVGAELWKANQSWISQHAWAQPWALHPSWGRRPSRFQIPAWSFLDPLARALEMSVLSPLLRARMNKPQDTSVLIDNHQFKTHLHDTREEVKKRYQALCDQYEVDD